MKSRRDGKEPGATPTRMLKIVLLWMSGKVQDKRRERTRLTLERKEAEEAGGLQIKNDTEGKAEEGRLEMFQGRRAGAQSCLCCLLRGGGQRGRGGNRGMNRGEEWLFSSVFSVQKETEEAGDKAIAYYSEYVRMLGGSRRESAGGREWLHCPNQRGQLPRGLKEQWEWRQH